MSFLVSTLSGIAAGFVRLAAFLFIGIKVRPPLREDGLLLFIGDIYFSSEDNPSSIISLSVGSGSLGHI